MDVVCRCQEQVPGVLEPPGGHSGSGDHRGRADGALHEPCLCEALFLKATKQCVQIRCSQVAACASDIAGLCVLLGVIMEVYALMR